MKLKKHLGLRIPLWWPNETHWGRLARRLLPTPGNVLFTLVVVGGLLLAINVGAMPLRAPALTGDSTTTISYQGRLLDSQGDPVPDGDVGIQFRLYDTGTGGSPVWEEHHTAVPVEDGLFHVLLGNVNPIQVSDLADNSTLWLGITVGSDSEMSPREQIASAPYAMIANTVQDGSITTDKIADEAVTLAKLDPGISFQPLYEFGGMHVTNPHTGACQRPNPFVGSCGCPPGFSGDAVATVPHGEMGGMDCNGLYCWTWVCWKDNSGS